MRRVTAVTAALAALLIAGCASTGAATGPSSEPSPTPGDVAVVPEPTSGTTNAPPPASSAHPARSAAPSVVPPSATPAATPTPLPSATPSRAGTRPAAAKFWGAVAAAVADAPHGHLSIAVRGAFDAVLRFEPSASATVVDGEILFVCRNGRAFDGQAGFAEMAGRWTCGSDALVRGFRTMGQPVDAWTDELPLDDEVRETYDVLEDGDWRWRYRAENDILGSGPIRVTVVIDPATGRITAASRTDPLGRTTWKPTYGASFPEIAVP